MMNAINQLLAVSATPDAYFRYSEVISWPEAVRQYYERYGILSQQTSWETVCDQCDEEHTVEIETDTSPDGSPRFFYFCPTAGFVTINPEHMKTWRVDFGRLAGSIAESLELDGDFYEIVNNRVWRLGEIKGEYIHAVFLIRGSSWYDGVDILRRFSVNEYDVIISYPTSLQHYLLNKFSPKLLPIERLLIMKDGAFAFDTEFIQTVIAESDNAILKQLKKKSNSVCFPTPTGANWSDVNITFIDNQTISVSIRGVARKYTCFEIEDFHDSRSKRPNKQWEFFQLLAYRSGTLNSRQGFDGKNQKTKEKLDHALRALFGINDISISWDDSDKRYITAFNLRENTRGG